MFPEDTIQVPPSTLAVDSDDLQICRGYIIDSLPWTLRDLEGYTPIVDDAGVVLQNIGGVCLAILDNLPSIHVLRRTDVS